MKIEFLDWDSRFFNLKIGKLEVYEDTEFDAVAFKNLCKSQKYDLVYVFKFDALFSVADVLSANLELFDIMLTMSMKFDNNQFEKINHDLKTTLSSEEGLACYKIAEQVSAVSRFNKEPFIGSAKTKNLYRKWIENALNQSFSDGVFIHKIDDKVCGLHVVKTDSDKGIGYFTLTGIDENFRGKGIGSALWKQSFAYWASKYRITQVLSSFSFQNSISFNFHLSFGFSKIEKVKYIYHYRR